MRGFLFPLLIPMILQWSFSFTGSNLAVAPAPAEYEEAQYDYSAYTECKQHPEAPLYNGGVIKGEIFGYHKMESGSWSPSIVLVNLTAMTRYSFSCWLKIRRGATDSGLLKARLSTGDGGMKCIGTSIIKQNCWSFLKGGFVLDSPSESSIIFFQITDGSNITDISVESASLQPFSVKQWEIHQNNSINTKRKRNVAIHASDPNGNRIPGASVSVQQISRDFPFGSAIAKTILSNQNYQQWFTDRFNAAVFENELKWYTTEPHQFQLNYTLPDAMLRFVHSHQILARGHNIFWEDPHYTPPWVRNLTSPDLRSAVRSRIQSLLSRYKGDFVHWDVSNEMLHYDFYEGRLGRNAAKEFFEMAGEVDPMAGLFVNDYGVVEGCEDGKAGVDLYVEEVREMGGKVEGIGIEGHFEKPDVVLMRGVIDKLGTMGLPIWLTEVDIAAKFDRELQAKYLEEVLREGFSHPSVNGIILWTALHPNTTCYQMCLTDDNLQNLPAGDVVDRLLEEWQTREAGGETDDHGTYSFDGFLGEYKIVVSFGNHSAETTMSLCRGDETKHLNVQLL